MSTVPILNLANPLNSEVSFKKFRFPDGQIHLSIESAPKLVSIVCRLATMDDFLELGLALNQLKSLGSTADQLFVGYVLGARMDRKMTSSEPFSFKVIANIFAASISRHNVGSVHLLDIHSQSCVDLLREALKDCSDAYVYSSELPVNLYKEAFNELQMRHVETSDEFVVISPDKGARNRSRSAAQSLGLSLIECEKKRDPATGILSGFSVSDGNPSGKHCIIVDDICDGGGTFIGISNVLREQGAKSVHLVVSHGIFSKGLPLQGIDSIHTTDSFTANMKTQKEISFFVHSFEENFEGKS